jgi:hypothetical protein
LRISMNAFLLLLSPPFDMPCVGLPSTGRLSPFCMLWSPPNLVNTIQRNGPSCWNPLPGCPKLGLGHSPGEWFPSDHDSNHLKKNEFSSPKLSMQNVGYIYIFLNIHWGIQSNRGICLKAQTIACSKFDNEYLNFKNVKAKNILQGIPCFWSHPCLSADLNKNSE